MQFTMDLTGLQQLRAELNALPQVLQTRVIRGAVAAGAHEIKTEAVRRAPVGKEFKDTPGWKPGRLRDSIVMIRLGQKCDATHEWWAVDTRKTGPRGCWFSPLVEQGHFARVGKGEAKTRKQRRAVAMLQAKWVPAHPFMRPAAQAAQSAAISAMNTYLRERLADATRAMRFMSTTITK